MLQCAFQCTCLIEKLEEIHKENIDIRSNKESLVLLTFQMSMKVQGITRLVQAYQDSSWLNSEQWMWFMRFTDRLQAEFYMLAAVSLLPLY